MAYISKINIGGTIYDIKDAEARELIKGGVTYIGRTTTALVDEATTSPITVGDKEVTPEIGNLVIYNAGTEFNPKDLEFIWNGEHWDELGSTGALGELAYKDEVSGSVNLAHTHTISTEDATAALSGGATVGVAVGEASITPAGTVTVGGASGTDYTPAGEVAVDTTESKTISGTSGNATVGAHTYTPEGSVSCTGVTVKGTVVPKVDYYKETFNVADEVLTITQNLVAASGSSSDISATATLGAFTFTGTQATLSHAAHSHTFSGNVAVPKTFTFTGTPTKLGWTGTAVKHTHTVTQGSVTGSVTYKKPVATSGSALGSQTITLK